MIGVAALYRGNPSFRSNKMPTIPEFLRARFPEAEFSNHYVDLLGEYLDSGLAPPNVEAEIMTGDRGLYAHVWEAMLYRHLRLLGFGFHRGNVRRAGQRGPDFGIIHERLSKPNALKHSLGKLS